ncbi:MAG: DNA polymerase III subunit beta [Candidatus Latescibacteria bacterium]|nr:DNA polymerase III subunit beta [Candidatus Latescibacterota bacterium]
MKGSFLRKNLITGINKIVHLASSEKSSLPILGNVLLQAEKGFLRFVATNLEVAIETQVRGKIDVPGSFTAPASLFSNHLNFLNSEMVSLEVKGGDLFLEHKNGQTKIKGLPADDFPIIPRLEKIGGFNVSGEEFKKALQQVVIACSGSEIRPEISGILFYQKENKLFLVGTDSYRLAEKSIKIKSEAAKIIGEKRIIVPVKNCQELLRIIESTEIEIFFSEAQILFTQEPTNIISRLVQAEFPNYQEIIPSDFKTRAVVDKEELIKTIRGASPFSKTGINDIFIEFLPEKSKIVVSSLNSQTGEARLEIKADVFGKKNSLSFNFRYILEGLTNLVGNEVSLKIIDDSSPAVLQTSEEKEFLYLLMPIKA